MVRAMYGRINLQAPSIEMPTSYQLNIPLLSPVSTPETRSTQKATSFAFVWFVPDDCMDLSNDEEVSGGGLVEIINTSSGKLDSGNSSKLCKLEMFRQFLEVWKMSDDHQKPVMYSDAKKSATDYQTAKQMLYQAFKNANLGTWIKKPVEQDQFSS